METICGRIYHHTWTLPPVCATQTPLFWLAVPFWRDQFMNET